MLRVDQIDVQDVVSVCAVELDNGKEEISAVMSDGRVVTLIAACARKPKFMGFYERGMNAEHPDMRIRYAKTHARRGLCRSDAWETKHLGAVTLAVFEVDR